MPQAIYRTYRPQLFKEMIGQEHVKVTLQNEIASGKVAHAYLFCGPRGIGKTTAARLLAKSLNCEQRKEGKVEPCNKCSACISLVRGADLDIIEIDAASHTGVDNVRENIIENARFTPTQRKFKVFIIDEAHMLSISAFNALLKLLEEPPTHVIFILATTESHKIPATIISRCQRFDFKKIMLKDIIDRLEKISKSEGTSVDKKVFQDIARLSEGCLRDAESLLGQILSLGDNITKEQASLVLPITDIQHIVNLFVHLKDRDAQKGVALVNSLVEDGVNLAQFTTDFIEVLRKSLLLKIQSSVITSELDEEAQQSLKKILESVSTNELIELITLFSKKKQEIKDAPIAQLPLEIAVIEFCEKGNTSQPSQQKIGPSAEKSKESFESVTTMSAQEVGFKKKSITSNITPPLGRGETSKAKEGKDVPPVSSFTTGKDGVKVSVTIDQVKEKWNEFLMKLQDINASLTFILKVAEPMEIESNKITIGLQYAFHQKRLMEPTIKEAIEEGLFLVFGEKMICDPILLDKDYKSDFIEQQTESDEVEFVQDITSEKAEEFVARGHSHHFGPKGTAPTSILTSTFAKATVDKKTMADRRVERDKNGELAEKEPVGGTMANEMIEKLVETFGGRIVE